MNILIRCDSSYAIGTGHVFRCLVLAIALRKSGRNVIFACQNLEGNIISSIEEKQFKVIVFEQNVEDLSEIIFQFSPSWVIVDHYDLGISWERKVQDAGVRLFVIDDLYRKHMCSSILNQNSEINRFLRDESVSYFLGPEYVLLSEQFFELPIRKRDFNFFGMKKILVFFGGADSRNETMRVLKLIPKMDKDLHFVVVIGKNNPHYESVKNVTSSLSNVELHFNTSRMHELLNQADLFLGAGGTVTWERCYLGLPAICVSVAENQEAIAQDLHDRGVHYYLGRAEDITDQQYLKIVKKICSDTEVMKNFHINSIALKVATKFNKIIEHFGTIGSV